MDLKKEAARRRTFAIISHPDAGKTTITEKLLLYSNSIHLAGAVKNRKNSRSTISDWMAMEQERGISISSSVIQFEHMGSALNLLDTPGHADFSEDTYRTLAAVDSALMLLDHAKGVEARTRKLFEVCRMRKLPVITFMNKLDRDGLDPVELLDEVSETLNLKVTPLNWPIGMGHEFKGVVDLATREAVLYDFRDGVDKGSQQLNVKRIPLEELSGKMPEAQFEQMMEEIALVEEAGDPYDHEAFLAGELSPVFWGSAMTNAGIEPLLEFLASRTSPPRPRVAVDDQEIEPDDDMFTGFVFKIQANMNPRHRDRIAFLRVVSGQFERGMDVKIGRSGEPLRLSKPHSFLAQERAIVEEAWPGDIVGLYDPGKLRIGDTISSGELVQYAGIPRFAPEFFVQALLEDPLKRKALDKGLEQLSLEGVVQLFIKPEQGVQSAYLGAVGMLQFEVLKQRLLNEYSVNCRFESTSFKFARWVEGPEKSINWLRSRRDYNLVEDRHGNPVLLTDSPWALQFIKDRTEGLIFHEIEPL